MYEEPLLGICSLACSADGLLPETSMDCQFQIHWTCESLEDVVWVRERSCSNSTMLQISRIPPSTNYSTKQDVSMHSSLSRSQTVHVVESDCDVEDGQSAHHLISSSRPRWRVGTWTLPQQGQSQQQKVHMRMHRSLSLGARWLSQCRRALRYTGPVRD